MSPFASRQFSQFAINTMMLLLSLLFCFLLKLGTPILVQSCTDCWCVPGDGTFDSPGYSNFCPKLKKRELVYDNETIEGFLDYTEIGDFVGLEPPDCQPYPNLASALDQEQCDPVTTKTGSQASLWIQVQQRRWLSLWLEQILRAQDLQKQNSGY
jgi:hypothetical protein